MRNFFSKIFSTSLLTLLGLVIGGITGLIASLALMLVNPASFNYLPIFAFSVVFALFCFVSSIRDFWLN